MVLLGTAVPKLEEIRVAQETYNTLTHTVSVLSSKISTKREMEEYRINWQVLQTMAFTLDNQARDLQDMG